MKLSLSLLLTLLLAMPVMAAKAAPHLATSGAAPSADCGALVGTDSTGTVTVTVSGNPSVCTVTFAQTWHTPPPVCVGTHLYNPANQLVRLEPMVFTSDTSAEFHYGDLGGQQSDSLSVGDVFSYICAGH